MKRILIKIGSSVLTKKDGQLNKAVASSLIREIAELKYIGVDVILVTSGAVSLGKSVVDLTGFKIESEAIKYGKDIIKEQVLASIGQPKLMAFYTSRLSKFGMACAQILTTRSDFADREKYLSLRTVIENLLKLKILPIFNENDVLSPEELDFSDNDQLAYMVAAMLGVDEIIILSNVDGVYDGSPKDPKSKIVPVIDDPIAFIEKVDASARTGKGGMESKLQTAKLITSLGISMHIASGLQKGIISKIVKGGRVGTHFPAKHHKVKALKNWLATAAVADGRIVVSTFLADILRSKKTASVLFSGIEKVEGNFREKDVVEVCDEDGVVLGRGVCRFSAENLRQGVAVYREKSDLDKVSAKTQDILAVHYDYFIFA